MILKIALPKGSLQEATFGLFKKAGWDFRTGSRSYHPSCDDPEIEAMMTRHLARLMKENDAPAEQYARLGLEMAR